MRSAILLVAIFLTFSGCQKPDVKVETKDKNQKERNPMTEEKQGNLTKEEIIQQFKDGNERFLKLIKEDSSYNELLVTTSTGQFPKAIVLSCIDSRAPVEDIFDKNIGDVFTTRVAGNYADSGVIGGMEFACQVSGAKVILVMGHTECGAIKGACDNVQLGNLSYVIDELKPGVDSTKGFEGNRTSKNKDFVKAVTEENVIVTINKIRSQSKILSDLEKEGKIKFIGAVYDIATGRVTFLNQ